MKAKARKPKKIRMKTKKTFAKRSKLTATGKLKVQHNFVSHFAANKTHKQKMHLAKSTPAHSSDLKRTRQLLQG